MAQNRSWIKKQPQKQQNKSPSCWWQWVCRQGVVPQRSHHVPLCLQVPGHSTCLPSRQDALVSDLQMGICSRSGHWAPSLPVRTGRESPRMQASHCQDSRTSEVKIRGNRQLRRDHQEERVSSFAPTFSFLHQAVDTILHHVKLCFQNPKPAACWCARNRSARVPCHREPEGPAAAGGVCGAGLSGASGVLAPRRASSFFSPPLARTAVCCKEEGTGGFEPTLPQSWSAVQVFSVQRPNMSPLKAL